MIHPELNLIAETPDPYAPLALSHEQIGDVTGNLDSAEILTIANEDLQDKDPKVTLGNGELEPFMLMHGIVRRAFLNDASHIQDMLTFYREADEQLEDGILEFEGLVVARSQQQGAAMAHWLLNETHGPVAPFPQRFNRYAPHKFEGPLMPISDTVDENGELTYHPRTFRTKLGGAFMQWENAGRFETFADMDTSMHEAILDVWPETASVNAARTIGVSSGLILAVEARIWAERESRFRNPSLSTQ